MAFLARRGCTTFARRPVGDAKILPAIRSCYLTSAEAVVLIGWRRWPKLLKNLTDTTAKLEDAC